ncbi:hypothetical protein AVEN_187632-1 [Araneus ventricosus]|uniref:Uncharacterized protein n=1 Tax=Araneus ventricosus TaxID=182803 RepID=A0A4Y2PZJ0_ARAVE|nr:hypothetical protein AVEN_17288-1 [Araneus ventricosus]GBN55677.1 hypothetical protein AVEN_187632-1 [Araneus ventricosus]
MKSISRNHPGKNRCPSDRRSASQPIAALHCFGSDVSIVLTSMQEKGESMMCKIGAVGWVIHFLPSQATNVLFCVPCCVGSCIISTPRGLLPFLKSCDQLDVL